MQNTMVLHQKKRNKLPFKWWLVTAVVLLAFILSTVSVFAVITGFNFYQVGATSYTTMAIGDPWAAMTLYLVGGYSTNERSNTVAQVVIPAMAFLAIIIYALRSFVQQYSFEGFIKTVIIIIVGAVMFSAVVYILSQLT